MSDWTDASQANYLSRKRKLALAQTSGDLKRIIRVCTEAATSFNTLGWPDNWPMWRNAYDDAVSKLQRQGEPVRALVLAGEQLFR